MAILLNLSWAGDTVLICIGEEEVFEGVNKQRGFLSPSGILSLVLIH